MRFVMDIMQSIFELCNEPNKNELIQIIVQKLLTSRFKCQQAEDAKKRQEIKAEDI